VRTQAATGRSVQICTRAPADRRLARQICNDGAAGLTPASERPSGDTQLMFDSNATGRQSASEFVEQQLRSGSVRLTGSLRDVPVEHLLS